MQLKVRLNMDEHKRRKSLFISNGKYLDPGSAEGGVKLCTQEYIELISTRFEALLFPIETDRSFWYRIKKKAGLAIYEDYNVFSYSGRLVEVIREHAIDIVFLNMTNTIVFSALLRQQFPALTIVLCSHGNESGDFLHDLVIHNVYGRIKKIMGSYALGKLLIIESRYRAYIDLVLTVSTIEENIELWIGAPKVKMIPRTIQDDSLCFNPINGKVGFFGDLSHNPNFYGLEMLCTSLSLLNTEGIEIRIAGAGNEKGAYLAKRFSFVTYLGYLPEAVLAKEVETWTFALNPVFYYSRGVSTKLGKALGWGLPVITSIKGMRGYLWQKGEVLSCETPGQMASLIIKYSTDAKALSFYREQIIYIRNSSASFEQSMAEVCVLLNYNAN